MNFDAPLATLVAVMLGSVRAGAWLLVSPPFNSRLIPGPVKALMSVGLALSMTPYLIDSLPPLTASAIITSAALQFFVGASLGFITALYFAALQAAGDLLDVFGGFTLASAFDPLSLNQSSVFGRFYNLVAMTLLFATDAYQMILRGFLQSYKTLPLGETFSVATLGRVLTQGVGELFLAALQIAGPLIAILFLTDVAFGLLNRVAPSLNAFQLGFPAKIFLLLTLSGIAIATLPRVVDTLVDKAVIAVVQLSGG
ncbi:flagellar biosynthetic protein FliR [Krasilnikovia sp. M28-CT-15]|uniref:flagellar biosynthetic protein FliR n=1 Tax=Krasilnikovia sp. M28-CT-15 TaxID=3373540 RepID=UPI003875DC33